LNHCPSHGSLRCPLLCPQSGMLPLLSLRIPPATTTATAPHGQNILSTPPLRMITPQLAKPFCRRKQPLWPNDSN
jgi:hypothetical protein